MLTLDTALMWHSLGIATIPILAGSKAPALCSWREFQTVLPRESQLRAWFSNPSYNIAVITGWRGLVVVDWDDMEKQDEWFAGLSWQARRILWHSYYVVTPRGGCHYYFFVDKPTRCLPLGGVDIKSSGGYVLVPPSQGYLKRSGDWTTIQHITSIEDLHLPGYTTAMQPKPRPPYDAFEDAMKPWVEGNGAGIEAIKATWSVADVLGVTNGRSGRVWHTTCPLHQDTNPSLAIYPDGHWFCFGCRQGGDVIDLYAALHKIDNGEAIRRMSNDQP